MPINGDLADVSVSALLALMVENARPSRLVITSGQGEFVICHDGTTFVDASCEDEEGLTALMKAVVLTTGHFILEKETRLVPKTIFESQENILRAARTAASDHASKMAADPHHCFVNELCRLKGVHSVILAGRDGTQLAAGGTVNAENASTASLVGAFLVHSLSESITVGAGKFLTASFQYKTERLSVFVEKNFIVLITSMTKLSEHQLLTHLVDAMKILFERIRPVTPKQT
ncbi:MAG: DUF4388 domain-containing protein [Acidobacteria bacterium]|nr:DUF4388 domain-containing protein [Acidobacteriota bacterium]